MFSLHPHASARSAARPVAEAKVHEVHPEPAGPLDGELLDLYLAILIVVPAAFALRSFFF